MTISVLTPEREIFNGDIVSVKVPGVNGSFQILNNHAPIVSALEEGVVSIETAAGTYHYYNSETKQFEEGTAAGQKYEYKVDGGFIEVNNNEVSLLISGLSSQ